jgi:hypothetical protein
MSATRTALVAVLAGCFVLSFAAPASAAQVRDCGNYGYPEGYDGSKPIFTQEDIVGAGVYDIRAKVTRCRPAARRMVRRFWNGRWGECDPGCRRGSFRCRNRQTGDEVWIMRCTASRGRVVRFEYGA